jgi:predicted NUDIX family phosphoesterase
MTDREELVLCSPTGALPPDWLPDQGSLALAEDELLAGLASIPPLWLPRSRAETDPAYKQWIPYGLVREAGGRFACYRRRGSEGRLRGIRSLGIGGHINPVDLPLSTAPVPLWRSLFWNGFIRELSEELPMAVPGQTRFLGLIHESRTEVGKVHIGLVFLHQTSTPIPMDAGDLAPLDWLDASSLLNPIDDHPETWSLLALKLLPCNPPPS